MDTARQETPLNRWLLRVAYGVWIGLTIGIIVKAFLTPHVHTVFPLYHDVGTLWAERGDLFSRSGYQYSPLFAAVVVPFAWMGVQWGAMVWAVLSTALFLLAIRQARVALFPADWTDRSEAAVLLLTIPVGLNGIWNLQTNLPIISFVILGAVAMRRSRWWSASVLLAIPFWIKVAPISFGMLLAGLWPKRLVGRLCVVFILLGAMTFLFAPPSYVVEQYEGWWACLTRLKTSRHVGYRDAWTMVEILFQGERTVYEAIALERTYRIFQFLRLATAAGVFVWLWHEKASGAPMRWLLVATMTMGGAWLMAFGPSTEFATYAMFAPAAGWCLVEAWKRKLGLPWMLATYLVLLNGANHDFERLHEWWTGSAWTNMLAPVSVFMLAGWFLVYGRRMWEAYRDGTPEGKIPAAVVAS